MIDIHPPQHGAMTRRDILTHLAIVVLGILIAIGLEQAMEALHHRRERNELIRTMRTEAENNIRIFESNRRIGIVELAWCRNSLAALLHATPHNGIVEIALPPREPAVPPTTPERAAWAVATTNGTVALLPDNVAEMYQRLDLEADQENKAQDDVNTAGVDLNAISARLGLSLDPGTTLHLSTADRDSLIQGFSRLVADWSLLLMRDAFWQGAADAVAHDVPSRDAFVPYMRHAYVLTLQAEANAGIPIPASTRAAFQFPYSTADHSR